MCQIWNAVIMGFESLSLGYSQFCLSAGLFPENPRSYGNHGYLIPNPVGLMGVGSIDPLNQG